MARIVTYTTGTEPKAWSCAVRDVRYMPTPLHRGFTLLELTVVIAIALLLTGIAVPLITERLPGLKFNSAIHRIATHARLARNIAISSNAPVRLIIDVGEHRYRLSVEEEAHGIPEEIWISLYAPQVEQMNEQVSAILFYGDGSSSGGRVTLSDGVRKRSVDVQWLTGRVSILD